MATYDLTSSTPSKIQTGDILNCPYSGSAKQITLPAGEYKLECWGASGGAYSDNLGGKGGYSTGAITLMQPTAVYVYAGGKGVYSSSGSSDNGSGGVWASGGFNGGGDSGHGGYKAGSGGGASDIRINADSLYNRVIVAGGGGGMGNSEGTAGYGGGASGGATSGDYGGRAGGTPGTQTNAGSYGASFGVGGYLNDNHAGGGGGGWYGGGAGQANSSCGAGGSGYVYTSSTASNYPSGCLLNSSYYLTNASTVAGNTSFTSPSGSSETGHTGNGYCRITVISCSGGIEPYVKVANILPSGYTQIEYIESTGTQYIDTGFIPNQDTRVDTVFSFSSTANGQIVYGSGVAYNDRSFELYAWDGTYQYNYGGKSSYDVTIAANEKIKSSHNKNNVSVVKNGVTYTINFGYTSFTTPYTLTLFALHRATIEKAPSRIYSCKIYDNGILIRDYVPCTNSNGIAGMYDLVNDKFYTDVNGGTFVSGGQYVPWKKISSILIKHNGKWIG